MTIKKKVYAAPVVLSLAIAGGLAGASSLALAKNEKVEICHKPGTAAAKAKEVPEEAVAAHLGHGDFVIGGKGKGKGKGAVCK